MLRSEHRQVLSKADKPVVPEVETGYAVFGASKVYLALMKRLRVAAAKSRENLTGVICSLAECIPRLEGELVPKLVCAEFQLRAVVVGIGCIRASAHDALITIYAAKLRMTRLSGA